MEIHGAYGLSGWQWLFIIEGLPSVLLGACFVLLMKDGPGDVRWLTPAQKAGLTRELDEEKKRKTAVANLPLLKVMLNKHILALSLTYSGVLSVGVCLSLWQPQLIKSFGLTNFQTGLLSSVPFGVATVVMVLWGRSSDRRIERVWHTVIPLVLSMCAMLATFVFGSLSGTIVLLSLMLAGSYSAKGPFWALVTQSVSAKTVAVGLAVVSGMGSIATALTTYLFGVIREHTGSYQLALLPLVALTLGGSLVLFVVGMQRPDAQAMPALETAEAQ
jgi:ACS family tartrate transporter-like MFS transporter